MSIQQRIAANERWAYEPDRTAATQPGRDVAARQLKEQLLREIDPDNRMTEVERNRRLKNARAAYFLRLAQRSAEVRREKSKKGQEGSESPS